MNRSKSTTQANEAPSDDEKMSPDTGEEPISISMSPSSKKNQSKTPSTPSKTNLDSDESTTVTKSQPIPSSSQSSTNSEPEKQPLVGRSGRIRKAKIVFDPSDMEVASKRRSMPVIEPEKPKKAPKPVEVKKEIVTPKVGTKSTPEKISPEALNERRKTISDLTFENGCIVCARSDTKKGRFVNCIDCTKRGHFTCLRNGKLLRGSENEKQWQCTACKSCAICKITKDGEQLYKCTSCFGSFHLHCTVPQGKYVTKKKFKCGFCDGKPKPVTDNDDKQPEANKSSSAATPSNNKKSSSDGFAGFSQEETTKSGQTNQKSSSPAGIETIMKHKKLDKIKKNRHSSHSSSSKSSAIGRNIESPPFFGEGNSKIKVERYTPTPDKDIGATPSDYVQTHMDIDAEDMIDMYRLRVKKDCHTAGDINDDGKIDDDLRYNEKTVIKPHDSVPDVRKWDCDEVYTYLLGTTTAEYAHLFKENQIDGDALLLIKREDVLNRFNLKLCPALRLYSHIVSLQYKNNNPILAWNEI